MGIPAVVSGVAVRFVSVSFLTITTAVSAQLANLPSTAAATPDVSLKAETYTIGGTVIGLKKKGTVGILDTSDDESALVGKDGAFKLPKAVKSGTAFDVTVDTTPTGQSCAVQNGSGTVADANVTDILVYCTYDVDAATLKAKFTSVGLTLNDVVNNVNYPYDYVSADTFDGVSAVSSIYTINAAGTVYSDQTTTFTYAVTSTNAIPSYTDNSPGLGGIEGENGDAMVAAEGMASGTQPQIYVGVLPDKKATTDSVNGTYTQVALFALLSTGDVQATEGIVTLTDGKFTGTLTVNTSGTITTNHESGQCTVSKGLITVLGDAEQGAVSADGNLLVLADTNPGDNPSIGVLVRQGTGVTAAAVEGVYSVAQYGGLSTNTSFGKAITLFAEGNGTYRIIFTKNAQGTITTNMTDSGTYTVESDGTPTLSDSEGNVYNGAISADGNALVLASVSSTPNVESPAIFVGVRQ